MGWLAIVIQAVLFGALHYQGFPSGLLGAAMAGAANFAFCNCQLIAHWVQETFQEVLHMGPGQLGLGLEPGSMSMSVPQGVPSG